MTNKRESEHRQEGVDDIDDEATEEGDGKEPQTVPCGKETDHEGDDSCKRGEGALNDGREGHHGKGDVGHIIEETAQKGVADGALDEQHGQDTNQVRDQNRQKDIKDGAILFHLIRVF